MKVGTDPDSWEKEKVNFTLLKPKLAYAAGRAGNKDKIHELRPVLDQAIDAVKPNEAGAIDRMNTFVQFLEAILAYHKAYGGKDN
jgi:CRISPR-associated protein Csm2